MQGVVDFLNGIIWSPFLIYLCLGAGLFYSIQTRFVQVRHFKEMCRLLVSNKESSKGISSFQALAVSLSGRVGTGNIAGVAAAIGFGGPGAVFCVTLYRSQKLDHLDQFVTYPVTSQLLLRRFALKEHHFQHLLGTYLPTHYQI